MVVKCNGYTFFNVLEWKENTASKIYMRVFGIFAVPHGFRHSSLQTWVMKEEDNKDWFKQVGFWAMGLKLSLFGTLFAY